MSIPYAVMWPNSPPLVFGWIYSATWDEANEKLAVIAVCEFLRWGAL